MKQWVTTMLIVLLFIFSGCATANRSVRLEDMSDEEIEAYNSNPANTDKIICTKVETIGSRIPKRVCYKTSSIEARKKQDQRAIESMQKGSALDVPKDGL